MNQTMTKIELALVIIVAVYFGLNFFVHLYELLHNFKVVKLKAINEGINHIHSISVGDWIDLASNSKVSYKAGDTVVIYFGVAMELPKGYEAHILPRSSTFQNTGLLLTNSMGIIDNSFCGDNDFWSAKFYATRDGSIDKGQRVCQFRIMKNQPELHFKEVLTLGNADRGGYGSTGK